MPDCLGRNRVDCPYREDPLPGPCRCEPYTLSYPYNPLAGVDWKAAVAAARNAQTLDLSGWARQLIGAEMAAREQAIRAELIRLGWTPPAETKEVPDGSEISLEDRARAGAGARSAPRAEADGEP